MIEQQIQPQLTVPRIMRIYYLQHKNGFNLFLGLLVLLYVNLMLPIMVRRRDYPQSYIEWIV